MMVDILDFEGYPIRVARNGNEALELMRGEESYLVFLDLLMPVMSGKDVCDILDKDSALRSRHVIVLMSALDRLEEAHDEFSYMVRWGVPFRGRGLLFGGRDRRQVPVGSGSCRQNWWPVTMETPYLRASAISVAKFRLTKF